MGCVGSKEPIDFDGPVDFKHFEILRAIGKGAFGKVCIVKKKDTKEMYALKYMNKIQIIEKRAVDNVFREIYILKLLEHPFIVNLWFAFQDAEDIFLVLDLMLGGDLSYHLEKEGRFNVKRVRLYMAELCLALEYLRDKSIIHRDLKPANMLLDSKGHIHLTDFNVACIMKEGKIASSMTGTKPYMAPEVIRPSSRGYSYSVDWWSLGVSVYEMLRGERPYNIVHGITNEEIYSMLTRVRPPASARWDEPTCNILKILLHPDSSKRLSSLEQAKTHPFFEGINWDSVLKAETTPDYVPSQNRIHCDPTHELEEMIVEPNPLHKKNSRLSRRNGHSAQEDSKLADQLNKVHSKFHSYDRIKESTALHEFEESVENTLSDSPPTATKELPSNVTSSLSLPKASLSRTSTEAAGMAPNEEGGGTPVEIRVNIEPDKQSDVITLETTQSEIQQNETTPTNDTPANTNDITPTDCNKQDTNETTPISVQDENVPSQNTLTGKVSPTETEDTTISNNGETSPTNLEAADEALSNSRSSEKIAPLGNEGGVDNASWLIIDSAQEDTQLLLNGETEINQLPSEDAGAKSVGISPGQNTEVQTVASNAVHVNESRTEDVSSY